jgi:CRP-like cAMP-binding protein
MNINLSELLRHHFLFALPEQEREHLLDQSDVVQLSRGEAVHEPDEQVRHIYFPLSAVLSLVGITTEGETVELCHVGTEGVVGISSPAVSCRIYQHRMLRTEVRLAGRALRISTENFLAALRNGRGLFALLSRYLDLLFSHLVMGATCNRHHSLERRCIRWMLSMQDRTDTMDIQVTQENMADVLGVRRQSIDTVLDSLERDGLIGCARGLISLIDRKGLEAAVCECYAVAKRCLEDFLSSKDKWP